MIIRNKDSENVWNKMNRSKSEIIKIDVPKPQLKKVGNHKFRRRSLMMKNVKIEDNNFASQQSKAPQTATELRFLADIIKKKQEPAVQVPSKIEQIVPIKTCLEYQYYDSIVNTLLSEIRSRSTRQVGSLATSSSNGKTNKKIISTESIRIKSPIKGNSTTIKVSPSKDKMIFSLSLSGSDTIYQRKITSLIQLLYKLNFANCLYVDLSLSRPKFTYKVKIGKGNNCALIKSLIQRRFWLEIVTSGQCQFSWTQLTDQSAHQNQPEISEQTEHARYKSGPKKQRILSSSSQEHLRKILRKQQMIVANQWYERSDSGKNSCYHKAQISRVSNHIPLNCIIGAKRILFRVMFWYYKYTLEKDPFSILPKTYSFQTDYRDTLRTFSSEQAKKDQVWVVKPGENTNRGNGIKVMETSEVIRFLNQQKSREPKPYIVQQYIKPFLYNGRKFDIRHFLLITSVNGIIRAFWYHEGYLRTCSQKYDMEDLEDEMIHLTNDAVQKRGQKYGKYEPANKVSYSQFQRYLDTTYPHKHYNFQSQILEKMKSITSELVKASFQIMDPNRKGHNFQLYGLDFYVSRKFKPYLIQCNANPCLQVNCPILERIIPGAVQHALRIGLDPLLPPPSHYPIATRYHLCDRALEKLKYEIIFDEKIDGPLVRQLTSKCQPLDLGRLGLKPEEELFEDDGSELSEGANLD